ncbi:MAG TPA: hypothetical protein VND64_32605 [Pirellulales bacterium]|nr:hypothetical protein [Pirellulales bacterium]
MLNVRKNQRRYAGLGVVISPTTKSVPHPSIAPQFAHAIEFALVQLRYRYGVSIDDVLIDPELGTKFEEMAGAMAPGISAAELRLGALYLRKTRHCKKQELPLFESLDPAVLDEQWRTPKAVGKTARQSVPSAPGLIEVDEGHRCLYVTQTDDLAPAVEQLSTGHPFELMANHFWKPHLDKLRLRFIAGDKINGVRARQWELRLIKDREPVFNWPLCAAAA